MLQPTEWFGLYLLSRVGFASVDERMLTTVGLGTKLALPFERFIPYLRATALHSHEMPVAAMSHDTFEHVMGVGDGTRHRFGVEGALGFTTSFKPTRRRKR